MASPQVRYTYEDYRQLPGDGQRYEVLDGELIVSPSPSRRHQELSKRLQYQLYRHVEVEHRLGEVFNAPFDVILSEDNVVQPDLLFVATSRLAVFSERGLEGAPDLVVEILSPSTRARDCGRKREVYARFGVRELWLVDPERDAVDVFERVAGDLAATGTYGRGDALASRVVPGLRVELASVFA
ncbi:MAG: Uma2 family endonuclease [Planctomycetes bacterium]|nr:Uma2 family endonuclease [Planctomycetota bacterium]